MKKKFCRAKSGLSVCLKGVSVLGIDLNQTMSPSHICPQLRSNFEDVAIRHDLYQHPVPSGLIRPVMYGDYVEDPYDTAYGLSEIIGQNKRLHLGPAQIATLADAIQPSSSAGISVLRFFRVSLMSLKKFFCKCP